MFPGFTLVQDLNYWTKKASLGLIVFKTYAFDLGLIIYVLNTNENKHQEV